MSEKILGENKQGLRTGSLHAFTAKKTEKKIEKLRCFPNNLNREATKARFSSFGHV